MQLEPHTSAINFDTIPVVMVKPVEIKADPATFQYRHSAGEAAGINKKAQFQGEWNDALHGKPLLIYETNEGQKFVVDGHHRLEFANRLKRRHSPSAPQFLAAQILKESAGITPEHAKIIGAFRNIATYGIEQMPSGEKLLEAAEALRQAMQEPEFAKTLPALPSTAPLLRAAEAATLSDAGFQLAHMLPEPIAVNIAAHVATRDMPDTDKIHVLSIIANHLAPLKQPAIY